MSSEPIEHDGVQLTPRSLLRELLERHVSTCDRDRTVVRVSFRGESVPGGEHAVDIVEHYDEARGLTAMARLTSWPSATISLMQCRGEIAPGVTPQETSVDPASFLARLQARGVHISGLAARTET